MKFLCLCYYDQARFDALSDDDLEAVGTLRAGSDGASVTDGPYVRTKEPVGAFFMIEAADLDEAVEVASKHPGAQVGGYFGGGIEVRPIDMLDQPGLS
jgi:hypothetical protein